MRLLMRRRLYGRLHHGLTLYTPTPFGGRNHPNGLNDDSPIAFFVIAYTTTLALVRGVLITLYSVTVSALAKFDVAWDFTSIMGRFAHYLPPP